MVNDQPTVSVIIPVYNSAPWIRQTMDSVLAQTYPLSEIIVIDDGSTDQTAKIVNEYYKRIVYINQENKKAATARNNGAKVATGDYLAFIDGDDLWEPTKIEKQIRGFYMNPCEWGYTAAIHFDNVTGKKILSTKSILKDGFILEDLLVRNFIATPAVMVKRSVFNDLGGFNEESEYQVIEDWELWLRLAEKYPSIAIFEELTRVRIHPTSWSGSTLIHQRIIREENLIYKVVSQHPDKLLRIQHRALIKIYEPFGILATQKYDFSLARECFNKVLSLEPLNIKARLYWLLLQFGDSISLIVLKSIRIIRSLIRGY